MRKHDAVSLNLIRIMSTAAVPVDSSFVVMG